MKKIPIIVTDLKGLVVVGEHEIYLINPNNKIGCRKIKRIIRESTKEITIRKNSFKLSFTLNNYDYLSDIKAYISSDELPTKDMYLVKNFDASTATTILYEAKHNNGVFDSNFEACFLGDNEVTFLSEEMELYKKASDEVIRTFYVKVGKKTTKWKEGHRYDNKEKTFYYLGSFLSHRSAITSLYTNVIDCLTPVHFYVENLKPGEKNIEDVIKNRYFGNDEDGIKVIWGKNLPSCLDSGQALEPVKNLVLSSYYDDLIKKNPYEVPNYLSEGDLLNYKDEFKEKIKNTIISDFKDLMFNSWDIICSDKKDLKENRDILIDQFLYNISKINPNAQYNAYYTEMFKALGIDLEKIATTTILSFDEDSLCENFDTFIENQDYFRKRQSLKSTVSYQRSNDESIITIENIFGDTELTKTLIKIIDYARDNFGDGVERYKEIGLGVTGTKKPTTCVCTITCDDIINFSDSLSDNLKKEILDKRFTNLVVYFDIDTKLK